MLRLAGVAGVAGVIASLVACGGVRATAPSKKVKLAILPAESDAFPKAAAAVTAELAAAQVRGVDERQVATVSLEVVQLSIECLEPTVICYEQVGKTFTANQLLFAQIAAGAKKTLEVTVTLFDVDARVPKSSATKVFANEKAASAGIAALVVEATR